MRDSWVFFHFIENTVFCAFMVECRYRYNV